MTIVTINDESQGTPEPQEPDAHGGVALLLTESLIHSLVENSTLTSADALQVIKSAREVKVTVATHNGEPRGRVQEPADLLTKMAFSFKADI